MHFLPKANPLYENISVTKIVIPDVLDKLGKGGFTGYLGYGAADFEACCIFAKGKLLCVLSSDGGREKSGFEALVQLFDKVLAVGGEINVYRMTAELAMCAHALTLGDRLFNGEEVRQVDVRAILARLKGQGMNGVVHFFTPERSAMIFYRDGLPIGFYHDQAATIETSPDESRTVAALPGARVAVCSTKPIEELMQYDLLQMVNLEKLWETARSRHASSRQKEVPRAENAVLFPDHQMLRELVEDLEEVAGAYLSRAGREMVAARMKEGGGAALLYDEGKQAQFLNRIEADARAYDEHARIDEMIDLMTSEIAGRLAV